MRITLFFLFFCILFSSAANSFSQEFTFNLKSASIREICKQIEKESDYVFVFSDNSEKMINKKVNIEANSKNVVEILDAVLSDTGLTYKILDKQIVVYESGKIISTKVTEHKIAETIIQQPAKKQITGRVVDAQGEAIIGANIIETGTTNGTVTDIDGKFSLSVDNNATIHISYIGYLEQDINTAGRTSFDITLLEDTQALDEVVVIGYGTMKKSDLTGSVVRANIESFREFPNVNIAQSLHGSVPGLNIGQIDQAGEDPSASIRGRVTISGNQSLLTIVDGIIYTGGLGDLNPSDIESVDVLKDPSSKAIYGAQAANGVMIVTTKKGREGGKPVINYNGSFGIQTPANSLRFLNREEYIQKAFDMDWQVAYEAPDYTQLKPNLDEIYRDIAVGAPYVVGYDNGTDYDWLDNLTNPGYTTNHTIGINGNMNDYTYYISGGYTKQKGYLLNDEYERIALRINLDNNVTDWLKIGAQTFGTFSDYSGGAPSMGNISVMSPLLSPVDENGEYVIYPNGIATNPFSATKADDFDKRNALFGSLNVDVNLPFIKGLNYRYQIGGNYLWDRHYYSNIYDNGLNGRAYKLNSHRFELTSDHILSYKKTINRHNLDFTLVYGSREINFENTNADGTVYNDLSLSYNNLGLAGIKKITSSAWKESYLYQMARINYVFNSKYLLTATIRRDGFSGFSAKNKFGVFPSVGLGWIISEENFLNSDWISNLKLRASYGENGNLCSRYSSLSRMNIFEAYVFGDGGSTEFGHESTSMPNDYLSWETTTGFNFGIDFSLLDNRISGAIDYYLTSTTDLLYNISIPVITGYNRIYSNIGEIANRGIEFALNCQILKIKKFSWNSNFNISSNKNEIQSLLGIDNDKDGKEDDLVESGLFIGESINSIYDFESGGIIQFGDEVPKGFLVGTHRIINQDEDPAINSYDRKIIGRQEPAYRFGLLNEFQYKNFTFKFFINSVQGGKDGYLGEANTITKKVGDNMRRENIFKGIDYWTPSNPDARYRRLDAEPAYDYTFYGDRSFVRLQDVAVSYRFNELAKKIGLQSLKLSVSGKNLHTWTKWEGWDPETGSGLEANGLPVLKNWSIALDVIL